MKKTMILLICGILLLLLVGSFFILKTFVSIYGQSQGQTTHATTANPEKLESFLIDQWGFEAVEAEGNCITAIRSLSLSYEDACLVGASVFTDDLSPETYLSQAATIQADVESTLGLTDTELILSFRSTDGKEIFSVDSAGNISTCWTVEGTT